MEGNPDVAAAYARMSPALRGIGSMMFVLSILVADCLFVRRFSQLFMSQSSEDYVDLAMLDHLGTSLDSDRNSHLVDDCWAGYDRFVNGL